MASEGPNNPGTGANDDAVGTVAWSNPGNTLTSDDSKAQYVFSVSGQTNVVTNYCKATNFGFSIPTGATIDGIVVEIEKLGQTNFNPDTNYVQDSAVKIVKADGSIGTTNKGDTTTKWASADAYITYGGDTDLWDETWSPTDINDTDFGVVISANLTKESSRSVSANIDHIRITVHYTEAGVTFNPTMMQQIQISGGLM